MNNTDLNIKEAIFVEEAIVECNAKYQGDPNAPNSIRLPVPRSLPINLMSDPVPLPLTATYDVLELMRFPDGTYKFSRWLK